jgi:hypothetical protein
MSFVAVVSIALLYFLFTKKINGMFEAGEEVPPLKRSVVVDAMDEAVGRAVETDRPLAMAPATLGQGTGLAITMIGMSAVYYLASSCARTNARFLIWPAREDIINVTRQYVLDAYAAEGKLDEFDEDYTIRWVQVKWCGSKDIKTVHEMWEHNISSITLFGLSGCIQQQIQAMAPIIGTTVICGDAAPMGAMFGAVFGDYRALGEESLALGAYLTEEPIQLGGIYAIDYFKYFTLPAVVIGYILFLAGMPQIKDILLM